MLKHLASARLWTFLILLTAPALARAQALADRVPPDTILYVGWSGVESPGEGFKGSNLEAVLAQSNLPKVFDEFLPKVLDRIAKEDKEAAQGVQIIRSLLGPMWRHPSAIAFAGVDMNNPNGPAIKLMLLSQAGKESASLKKEIEELIKQAGQAPFPINVVDVKGLVAVVVGYDKPEAAIPDSGAEGKSLATNFEFTKALAQVGKSPTVTGYIDVEAMMGLATQAAGFASPDIQKSWAKAVDMLGLKGVKHAIWTQGFEGKDWGTQLFVDAPAPRTGLVGSMLENKPVSHEILNAIPKDSTMAGATHFDIAGFVTAIRSGVTEFDADAAKEMDDAIDQANKMVGFDIQKDLLASMGDEWAYYVDPAVAGNGVIGSTFINRLKDPAKAEESLSKLETFINHFAADQMKNEKEKITVAFRHEKIGNVTVHFLGFPGVSPAWAVQNGNLYIALYPEVVAVAASHVAEKGNSIASNPAFMELEKKLGEHPVASFQFVDVPKLAPNTYPTWMIISHFAGVGDILGVPAPVMILPSLGQLMPHLSANGQIAWTDDKGAHVHAISSFPGSELLASDPGIFSPAQAGVAISVLLPALNKARQQAQQVKSASNLKQIGMGAIMYANNHNGAMPKDLGVLVKEEELTPSIFINPAGDNSVPPGLTPEQTQQWVRENSDYVWNGAGKKNTMGPDEPLAWEKLGRGAGINILYGDGHVQFESQSNAAEITEKASAKTTKPADGGL